MSLPKTNIIPIERAQKAEAFLSKLIREYEANRTVDNYTLARLKKMRQALNRGTENVAEIFWGF
jgi:hypothetical protein